VEVAGFRDPNLGIGGGMIDPRNGVPGVNAPKPTSFGEFWPFYLSQHLHPMTQRVHAAGTVAALATGITALVRRRWKVVAASPLLAYGPAFASHFIWEGNRPVVLGGNPLWSALADLTMVAKVLTGRIGRDAAAVRSGLGLAPPAVTIADASRAERAA
jgi:hypothetical protein